MDRWTDGRTRAPDVTRKAQYEFQASWCVGMNTHAHTEDTMPKGKTLEPKDWSVKRGRRIVAQALARLLAEQIHADTAIQVAEAEMALREAKQQYQNVVFNAAEDAKSSISRW